MADQENEEAGTSQQTPAPAPVDHAATSAAEQPGKGEPGQEAGQKAGRPAKKTKKWPIAVGIVVAVLVVAGAGFFAWHEQPSFCNAVCHNPMDNYVEGYYNDASLMAATHKNADVTCLECHEAKIDQQISEGINWATGNFKTDAQGNIARVGVTADKAFCASSGCHDMAVVTAATQDWGGESGVNPHSNHQGLLDCSNCHSAHGTSHMYCNTCHDWKVPQGWTGQQN
ncbi:MAG: cytochrome c3 family protein [Raoultibacter sp.]